MNIKRVVIKSCQNPKALSIHTIDQRARNALMAEARKFSTGTIISDSGIRFPREDVVVVAENYVTDEVKKHLESLELPKQIHF